MPWRGGRLAEQIDGHGAALVALTLSASSDSVMVIPKFLAKDDIDFGM